MLRSKNLEKYHIECYKSVLKRSSLGSRKFYSSEPTHITFIITNSEVCLIASSVSLFFICIASLTAMLNCDSCWPSDRRVHSLPVCYEKCREIVGQSLCFTDDNLVKFDDLLKKSLKFIETQLENIVKNQKSDPTRLSRKLNDYKKVDRNEYTFVCRFFIFRV